MAKKKQAGSKNAVDLFPVVGIGASAGGIDAFKLFIKNIPPRPGIFILIQHLHPDFESNLKTILKKDSKLPLLEISDNMKIEADHIYIIPASKIVKAVDGTLKLSPRPSKPELSRPIDIFFESLAEVYQSHAIGVVLSGTASDGTRD